jgi:hypothetical protein
MRKTATAFAAIHDTSSGPFFRFTTLYLIMFASLHGPATALFVKLGTPTQQHLLRDVPHQKPRVVFHTQQQLDLAQLPAVPASTLADSVREFHVGAAHHACQAKCSASFCFADSLRSWSYPPKTPGSLFRKFGVPYIPSQVSPWRVGVGVLLRVKGFFIEEAITRYTV